MWKKMKSSMFQILNKLNFYGLGLIKLSNNKNKKEDFLKTLNKLIIT